jgi:hypothetical protein
MKEKEYKSGKYAPEHSDNTPAEPIQEMERVPTNEEYNQDLKERLEEKSSGRIIDWEELTDIAPDFAIWLKSIVRYGNVDSQVLIFWKNNKRYATNRFACRFYTNDNCYSISGYVPTKDKPKGYLGAMVSSRKPRVGEDWTRGNDLPDGSYSKETFDAIVRRIVAYELKSLQLWR